MSEGRAGDPGRDAVGGEEAMKIEDRPDVQAFLIAKIRDMLDKCTLYEFNTFKRAFPRWPSQMTAVDIQDALDVCEQTTAKRDHAPQLHNVGYYANEYDVYDEGAELGAAGFHEDCGDR
jgi:hypothetical protein